MLRLRRVAPIGKIRKGTTYRCVRFGIRGDYSMTNLVAVIEEFKFRPITSQGLAYYELKLVTDDKSRLSHKKIGFGRSRFKFRPFTNLGSVNYES